MRAQSPNHRFVEALEGRSLMSAVIPGNYDFNNDGRLDKAEVTSPTTITVSLLNADNTTYRVSAILTAPKSQPLTGANVGDFNHDGKLDISAGGVAGNHLYNHTWFGTGNGTFGNRVTERSSNLKWWV